MNEIQEYRSEDFNGNANIIIMDEIPPYDKEDYDLFNAKDFKKYTDNEYFIPVKLSHKAMALVFLGWPYGGDMPYLTIIVATENDVNIVFNKRMGLNSITTYPLFKMKVQTVLEEYDSNGKLCTPPMYAEIGLDGRDILYLKK